MLATRASPWKLDVQKGIVPAGEWVQTGRKPAQLHRELAAGCAEEKQLTEKNGTGFKAQGTGPWAFRYFIQLANEAEVLALTSVWR